MIHCLKGENLSAAMELDSRTSSESDQPCSTIFFEGDGFYEALLEDLQKSRRSILMEFYIFKPDRVGSEILRTLRFITETRKLRVRLMVDGIGSGSELSSIEAELAGSGVELAVFKPLTVFSLFRSGMHRRNHRKIVLIDGSICYLGGMNVKEEHSMKYSGPSRWRDTMLRIERVHANRSFFRFLSAGMFLLFESVQRGVYPLSLPNLLRIRPARALRSMAVLRLHLSRWYGHALKTEPRLYTTLFHRDRARYRREYFVFLRSAKECIYLCTPYFIANRRLLHLLKQKARQGVDVRLLTAGTTDVWSARQAGRSTYHSLLRSGVRIFEMSGRVFHAKQTLVDEAVLIGSGNIDYRSFLHNQELMVLCKDTALQKEVRAQWTLDVKESKEIHLSEWRRRDLWQKFSEKLCYGFRYYL